MACSNQTVIKQYKLHTTSYTKHKLTDDVHYNLRKSVKSTRFMERLNFEKELKSTVPSTGT